MYEFGKLGFLMYEQFCDIVDPHAVTINTQQTPNLEYMIFEHIYEHNQCMSLENYDMRKRGRNKNN